MSLDKVTPGDYNLEKEMTRKVRPEYNPVQQTMHPNSNSVRVDHDPAFFTSKFRDPLHVQEKPQYDYRARTKAHDEQLQKRLRADAQLVHDLPTYDEPSDDKPASRPSGTATGKRKK